MVQFHETMMGRKFYENDLPGLVKAVNRLADAVEESNRLTAAIGKEVIASAEKSDGRE